jgi:hypothetical protein
LVACKWTYDKTLSSRRAVLSEIQCLVVRMAGENATWRYTRIKRALNNLMEASNRYCHGATQPGARASTSNTNIVSRNNQGLANELIDAGCKSSRAI